MAKRAYKFFIVIVCVVIVSCTMSCRPPSNVPDFSEFQASQIDVTFTSERRDVPEFLIDEAISRALFSILNKTPSGISPINKDYQFRDPLGVFSVSNYKIQLDCFGLKYRDKHYVYFWYFPQVEFVCTKFEEFFGYDYYGHKSSRDEYVQILMEMTKEAGDIKGQGVR